MGSCQHLVSAASGMRIAETLAVDIATCLSADCSMIPVRQQVKGSKIVEYLKTEASYRIVDLCPEASEYLRKFVGDRKGPLLPSRKRRSPERRHMRSVAFGLQSLQSRGPRRTFGSSGWRTRTTTSPRSMRNKYARTTFGDRPWRRAWDSDSRFRRSFPSQLSVLSVKIVSRLQSR